MRILLMTDLYPPFHVGGHELRCKVNCDELRKRGHDIVVLTSNRGTTQFVDENVVLRILYYLDNRQKSMVRRRAGHLMQGLLARKNYRLTKQILDRFKPDIVLAGKLMKVSYLTLKAVKDSGIPTVHHIGHYDLPELVGACQYETNSLKKVYRRFVYGIRTLDDLDTNHIIVVSNAVREKYVKIPLHDSHVTVIPPTGIPAAAIRSVESRERRAERGSLRLLYVGRIGSEKGIDVGIEALQLLLLRGFDNMTLDVIGGGDRDYTEFLREMVRNRDMEKKVFFHKTMSQEEIFAEYKRHDILLVPSQWEEPFGMIVLEGMSQSIPVIASRVGGITDVIVNRENGLLVSPGSPEELADAVAELANDSNFTSYLVNNAVNTVRNKFTRESVVDRLENYLIAVRGVSRHL